MYLNTISVHCLPLVVCVQHSMEARSLPVPVRIKTASLSTHTSHHPVTTFVELYNRSAPSTATTALYRAIPQRPALKVVSVDPRTALRTTPSRPPQKSTQHYVNGGCRTLHVWYLANQTAQCSIVSSHCTNIPSAHRLRFPRFPPAYIPRSPS